MSDVTLEQNGPASQLASRFLRHEEGAFRQLCLLAAVANSRAVLAFLSQPPLLSTLCLCVKAGTPRMQRVCLRLLSLVLSTSVSPQYAEASGACTVLQQRRKHDQLVRGDLALEGDEKEEPEKAFRRLPGGRLIEALFLTLGSCLASQANDKDVVPPGRLPSPASAETKEGKEGKGENKSPRSSGSTAAASVEALARSNAANPFDQRNGEVVLTTAAELVSLLRHLLTSKTEWSSAVSALLEYSFQRLPELLKQPEALDPSSPALRLALAALSVAGGHTERLREGGRVETSTSGAMKEAGWVVSLDRGSGKIRVLFDHSPNRVIGE